MTNKTNTPQDIARTCLASGLIILIGSGITILLSYSVTISLSAITKQQDEAAIYREQQRQLRIADAKRYITTNDATVKIIGTHHTVADGSGKDMAIIEGANTKERRSVPLEPKLPIIGETWTITHDDNGNITLDKQK